MDGFWQRREERGDRDDNPYRASFAQIIAVADTDEEAERLYAEHILYFFNNCLHVYPGFADPPGYRTLKTLKAGKLSQLRKETMELFQKLTWKDLVESGAVIAGSPDTVAEQMAALASELRVGTVFCLMHTGNMPDWKVRNSSQLFAEKVMPRLKSIWPDHDPSPWWCSPMAERRTNDAASVDAARRHAEPEGVVDVEGAL
jgi:alkanesulfonate monooxygenase SsuD/methylene tetrahydromethanopterin reductase-like flavin-dependent oxidoreductase (luciferase family)